MIEKVVELRDIIAGDISRYAEEHNLQIHPGQDPVRWAELVIKKGGCPCVPGRNHCPCELALWDILELNRCRCGLFCNGDYLEEYNRLMSERKSRGRKSKAKFPPKAL